jgi:hypothetical protein
MLSMSPEGKYHSRFSFKALNLVVISLTHDLVLNEVVTYILYLPLNEIDQKSNPEPQGTALFNWSWNVALLVSLL